MVEVIAVDDFLFVCVALDVTLDILAAKTPLYPPRTRHFSGDMHLTLDISAPQTLNCRVPCSHAQRRTEAGIDLSLFPQPCHSCPHLCYRNCNSASGVVSTSPPQHCQVCANGATRLPCCLESCHARCNHDTATTPQYTLQMWHRKTGGRSDRHDRLP